MSCNVAPGPVLAEEEMLHDGEPVFALAWGGVDRSGPAERTPAAFPNENANRVFSPACAREASQ